MSTLAGPVIGHVLLHGHARNGAADYVESQVLQLFEADATLESPAVCSAIRYGPMSSGRVCAAKSRMTSSRDAVTEPHITATRNNDA